MGKASWTLMIYMAGDNSLSLAGERDLEEMRAIGSNDNVNVVVLYDSFGPNGVERGLIKKNGRDEQIERLKELNTGDPKNLIAFVDWATTKFPAERYGLILWSHGDGWRQNEIDQIAKAVGAKNYSSTERAGKPKPTWFFRSTWEQVIAQPTPSQRAICFDDNSGHSLDTVELGKVLARIHSQLGRKLDFLGMDACLMSSLEIAVEIAPWVHFLVAAEEVAPALGWAYEAVLGYLSGGVAIAPAHLAQFIVQSYLAALKAQGGRGNLTLTAYDLGRLDALVAKVNDLAVYLLARMPEHAQVVRKALQQTTGFINSSVWDLAMLAQALGAQADDADMKKIAMQVVGALQPNAEGVLVAHVAKGKDVRTCGGVSIYLPALRSAAISSFYANLRFATISPWLAFLRRFKEA